MALPAICKADAIPCQDLERRYDLVSATAVAIEIASQSFVAADNGCDALLGRLLDAGATPLARDREGDTALARAARAGHASTVQFLLKRGADPEQRNLQGATALFVATQANRTRIVQILAEAGAKTDAPGRSGVSPLSAAAFNGNLRLLEMFLARGADPSGRDATGKSAVVYAAARGFLPIVRRLLDAGVDPNQRYANDLTLLMWAAGHAHDAPESDGLQVVELLLQKGAPVNAVDDRGRTALMNAAELGHAAIVRRLLSAGADPTLRDKDGKTAADLADGEAVRLALTGG
jgi:ankyrin repeat protein